ncbi:MAG: ComF family protein [Sarcina sp.]
MKYHGGINILKYLFNCVLEIIYPKNYECVCCKQKIEDGVICKVCNLKSGKVEDSVLVQGKKAYSCKYYSSSYRKLIMNYKSGNNFEVGDYFVELLTQKIISLDLKVDYITYVPSSKKSIKRRGFDPAEYLSKKTSDKIKIKSIESLYKRENIKEQKKLTAYERSKNLKQAFYAKEGLNFLNGKTILLIDDVITTGQTLENCIKELEKMYNIDIIILTVIKSSI